MGGILAMWLGFGWVEGTMISWGKGVDCPTFD